MKTTDKQFLISGKERRELKKERDKLKYFIKNFWYYHQLDKDMYSLFNSDIENLIDDKIAIDLYNESINRRNKIETILNLTK